MPLPRTEVEFNPVEAGESTVESYPEPRDTEPVGEIRDLDPEDSPQALAKVTDDEIKSGGVYEKIIPFAIKERGGFEGEVTVDTSYDTRNSAYFNEAGELIDKETGLSGEERTRKYFEGKESDEQIEARIQRLKEINERLLAEPNTLIPTDDCVFTVDGVEIMQAGFAIMDSEKNVSYINLNIVPEGKPIEDDENFSIEDLDLEIDGSPTLENEDVISNLEISPLDIVAEAAETEEVIVNDEVAMKEAMDSTQVETATFFKSKVQFVPSNANVEMVNLITAQLTEEFGFTYELEAQTVTETADIQLTAAPIQSVEPIRIVFIDDIEKSSVDTVSNDSYEQVVKAIDIAEKVSDPEMRRAASPEVSQEMVREVVTAKGYEDTINSVIIEKSTTVMQKIARPEVALAFDEILITEGVVEQSASFVEMNQLQEDTARAIEVVREVRESVPAATITDTLKSSDAQTFEVQPISSSEIEISTKEKTETEKMEATVVAKIEIPRVENKSVPVKEIRNEGSVSKPEQRESTRFEIQESPAIQEQETRVRSLDFAKENGVNEINLRTKQVDVPLRANSLDRFIMGSARSASLAQYAEAANDNKKDVEILKGNGITMRRQLRAA